MAMAMAQRTRGPGNGGSTRLNCNKLHNKWQLKTPAMQVKIQTKSKKHQHALQQLWQKLFGSVLFYRYCYSRVYMCYMLHIRVYLRWQLNANKRLPSVGRNQNAEWAG